MVNLLNNRGIQFHKKLLKKWKKLNMLRNAQFVKNLEEMELNCPVNMHSMMTALNPGLMIKIHAHAAELQSITDHFLSI